MNLAPYKKTAAAVVIGLIGWGGVVITSDPAAISSSEWLQLATSLAVAAGVYQIANEPA